MQLLHLHLGEEVHVEAMFSSSLHSGSSDDVALLVEHQSIFLNDLEYPLEKMMRKEMMPALVSLSCRFVCTYSLIFHKFRVVSYGSHRTC